jgi:hypothetical protein
MTQGPFDDELRRAFGSLSDRLRSELTEQLNTIAEQLSASVQADRATAAAHASEEARAAATREIADRLNDFAAKEAEARERGRAEALAEAQAGSQTVDLTASERLMDWIRAIDGARSLTEILDTLVSCAGRETARAGVLVLRDNALRGWRFIGFDATFDDATWVELQVDGTGVIGQAIRTRAAASSKTAASAPYFAQLPDGREMLAVPLLLGGEVVAVLYADQGAAGEDRPSWAAAVEVLTRHAARAVEAMTAFRTAQAITEQPDVARDQALAAAGRTASPSEDIDAAKRYARLLVSEIKLYHEPEVIAGRRERDLMTRLGGEIARARVLYEQRVPALPGAPDHFTDELVRTLADGDASLL